MADEVIYNEKISRFVDAATNQFVAQNKIEADKAKEDQKSYRQAVADSLISESYYNENKDLMVQRAADALHFSKEQEKRDDALKKDAEKLYRQQNGPQGFKGMIESTKEGFQKMFDSQKTTKEIFGDLVNAGKSDIQMFQNMLAPLQAIPGMNTAIGLLSATGTFALKGLLTLATAEGRQKAIEWAAQKKQWAAEKLAAVKARVSGMGKSIKAMGKGPKGDEEFSFMKFIVQFLKKIGIALLALGAFVAGVFTGVGQSIARIFRLIMPKILIKAFSKVGSFVSSFAKSMKGLAMGTNTGKSVTAVVQSVKAFFGSFTKTGAIISKLVTGFKGMLQSPIVKMAGNFGKTLGRLFFPITILMSAWEAIKGMISGFTNTEGNFFEKIVGGLMGAVESLVKFFIAMPLDLIKDLIGWIAGMLGFDGIKESLSSFSFDGLFSMLFDKLLGITTYIANLISAVANGAKEALKAMWPGGESPVEGFNRGYAESMAANSAASDTGGSIDEASMENKHEELEIKKGNSNPNGGGNFSNVTNVNNTTKKVITVDDTSPGDQTAIAAAGGA